MLRVRSASVRNCALALRCLSFATTTRGSNVTGELKNVQLALVRPPPAAARSEVLQLTIGS